jgi:large subunit ribosomal protein L10e
MALRKASAYSRKKVRPYTRVSGSKSKAYIKAKPVSKIVKFNGGNVRAFNEGKFKMSICLVGEEKIQVRDNALESGRMFITKELDEKIPGVYYLEVKVYPHHILRENKTAAGAGADRLSSGMKHSFGVTIGRAAIVSPGKPIFMVACGSDKALRAARESLTKIKSKVPGKTRLVTEILQ